MKTIKKIFDIIVIALKKAWELFKQFLKAFFSVFNSSNKIGALCSGFAFYYIVIFQSGLSTNDKLYFSVFLLLFILFIKQVVIDSYKEGK